MSSTTKLVEFKESNNIGSYLTAMIKYIPKHSAILWLLWLEVQHCNYSRHQTSNKQKVFNSFFKSHHTPDKYQQVFEPKSILLSVLSYSKIILWHSCLLMMKNTHSLLRKLLLFRWMRNSAKPIMNKQKSKSECL